MDTAAAAVADRDRATAWSRADAAAVDVTYARPTSRAMQAHLVIATRADPALPLARLRARGELAEIRAADLRFTADAADAYLNEVMGLDLRSGLPRTGRADTGPGTR